MDNLPKQRWSRRLSTRPRPGDFALGSLESRAAARAVQLVLDIEAQEQRAALFRNLTPLEQAFIEGADDPGAQEWGSTSYVTPLFRSASCLGGRCPRLKRCPTSGESQKRLKSLSRNGQHSGPAFTKQKTLREMAEDRIRRERRGMAQTEPTNKDVTAKGE